MTAVCQREMPQSWGNEEPHDNPEAMRIHRLAASANAPTGTDVFSPAAVTAVCHYRLISRHGRHPPAQARG